MFSSHDQLTILFVCCRIGKKSGLAALMDTLWEAIARGYVPFIANVGLLALLAWSVSALARSPFALQIKQTKTAKAGLGLLFGVTSAGLMFVPIELEPGIFGDGRGAPLLLAGVIGGPLAAVITTTMAALTRLSIGGAGVSSGLVYVVTLGAIGLLYHYVIRSRAAAAPDVKRLVLLAAGASVATLPVVLLLPPEKQTAALMTIWPKLTIANIIGVAVLGSLLGREIQRLKWEAALVRSEQRFRDFAKSASDWYWETNAELKFTYVSERYRQITGFDGSTILGRTRHQVTMEETNNEKWTQHLADLHQHRPFKEFSYKLRTAEGDVITIAINGVPIFDSGGEFMGYRGIGTDITQRVEAEQAVLQARDKAEEANRAKSAFLANMSHELRTPLNAIIGFSEVIRDKSAEADIAKYREYASDIHDSAQHLTSLINDILDLSKVESGAADDLDEEEVDICDIAAAAERLVQPHAAKGGVLLEFDISDGSPPLSADARKLKQIMVNLLTNAVKFSPRGSKVVTRACPTSDGGYMIQVSDEGIGIAAEDVPKAMSLFGQIDGGLDRKYEGTGLGLPLIKALTEQHNGRFTLESEPHVGTTVTILLPPERVLPRRPPQAAKAYG